MTDQQLRIIDVENVTFSYAGSQKNALDDVSLTVPEGDFLGIIGPSGAGKSTLMYAINGVIPHYHRGDFYGSVRLAGCDTHETSLTDLSRVAATMFQDVDAQMVAAVVEDEVLFGLENFGVPHHEIPARVDEALGLVGIAGLRERSVASLSGGQRQKTALAAVLALRPKVLVLDEPTGALDPASSRQVFSLLADLNERLGITVVVVEQKIGLLSEYARRLAVMSEGRLLRCGPRREVLGDADALLRIGVNVPRVTTLSCLLRNEGFAVDRPACTVGEARQLIEGIASRALGADRRESAQVPTNARKQPTHPLTEATQQPTQQPGRQPAYRQPLSSETAASSAGSEARLECRGASFSYGGPSEAAVVQGVSFAIRAGEFVAIAGSNGAGKTTTSKLLNGLLKPTAGEVLVDGIPTARLRTSELARRVGMLFQNPDRQICQNTVADELTFGLRLAGVGAQEARRRTAVLVDEFGFDAQAAPYMLSRGERQLLALASVIAPEPEVLILDEPTCGLDYRECMDVMARVQELNRRGTTIVMITHDMEVALDFASRIIVMAGGQVVADGSPEAVFRDRRVTEEASLLPPQMIELSMSLSEGAAKDSPFASATTADALVGALVACGPSVGKVS